MNKETQEAWDKLKAALYVFIEEVKEACPDPSVKQKIEYKLAEGLQPAIKLLQSARTLEQVRKDREKIFQEYEYIEEREPKRLEDILGIEDDLEDVDYY